MCKRGLVTAGLCCCVSMLGWVQFTEAAADKARFGTERVLKGRTDQAAAAEKVIICHKADDVKWFELSVAAPAVPGHLRHGDCVVDDEVDCTSDSCDVELGCVHTPDNAACDDGNACTTDTCDPATGCVYTDVNCDDGNACTNDSCDPATGCVYTDNIVCGDGVVCAPEECESDADCPTGLACVDCVCIFEPECQGQTCADFTSCNPDSGCEQPVCGTIVGGGGAGACVEGATPCDQLAPCDTNADCPGSFCFEASCCGIQVCGPPFCPSPAAAAAAPAPGAGPTFGGQ